MKGPDTWPARIEIQDDVRDARLHARSEPRRRRHVADRVRAEGVDRRRRGKDRRPRDESGELRRVSFRLEPRDDGTRFVFRASIRTKTGPLCGKVGVDRSSIFHLGAVRF